jgi:ABC-type multidrug transport system fused ATPase/permease subunit
MDEFFQNISSISWWLGVVIVGILINVLSHYIQKKFDTQLSALSSRWKKRSEEKKELRKRAIEKIRENPNAQVFVILEEVRLRIQTVLFYVGACALILLAMYFKGLETPSDIYILKVIAENILLFFAATISTFGAMSDSRARELRSMNIDAIRDEDLIKVPL